MRTAALDGLRDEIPEPARDIRLNLQAVLEGGALAPRQRWLVALASAFAARNRRLREGLRAALAEQEEAVGGAAAVAAVIDDARAAAALMAMNNVFYRFRHMIEKPGYGERPARLRMNRLVRPAGERVEFELACLAVSAINGCESCVRSHEAAVIAGGLGEEQVHDAVRLAATVAAAAVALELDAGAEAAAVPAEAAAAG